MTMKVKKETRMIKYIDLVPLWKTLQRCIFKRISDIYLDLNRYSIIKTEQNVSRARSVSRSMLQIYFQREHIL